jgi:hypothetical protein
MRNFDEIISTGIFRRSNRENEILVGNNENGVFKKGKLGVIATIAHQENMIVEHVSLSRSDGRKPNIDEIEMVKNSFWNLGELNEVRRLYIPSSVVHLNRQIVIQAVN